MNEHISIASMGCISAAGKNMAETLQTFKQGHVNIGKITLFETDLDKPAFEVKDYVLKRKNRTLSLLLTAVEEALENYDGNLAGSKYRIGICIGTTVASQLNNIKFYKEFKETGRSDISPVNEYLKGNLADALAREYKLNGPKVVVVNACSSGADAIGTAMSWLKNDQCDIAIAGGADELNKIPVCGFNALGIISDKPCAPFDKDRKGLNLGEGAGVLILERAKITSKINARPELFIAAYGSGSDAYHLTAPHPDGRGLKSAISEALFQANITCGQVGFINAHGTATPDNDKVEGKVIKELFGPEIKMYSSKGYTGHTLGAAGAIETVFTALALKEGWVPKSAGFKNKDEEIGISPLKQNTKVNSKYALSTSLAFGGNNAALLIKKEA
ncbi:MAG: beta-ketoacyl-[acyl-carrier-protein] synthase family protein [Candidatus Omnitrophica bacterium]|nr:beta-ketoacyl-[acyl-carrier-protein] synthase family protein [Candidatus Omnitrophota bacterium]